MMPRLTHRSPEMKVLVLAALVAVSSARPRFLVIPLEDVEFEGGMMPRLPVYRMPAGLARQARAAQDEDSYQSAPYVPYADDAQPRDAQASGSNASSAPHASAGPGHVDYGAYTGGYGAFGWYTDHPVLLTGH